MVNSLESANKYLLSPLEKDITIMFLTNLFAKYIIREVDMILKRDTKESIEEFFANLFLSTFEETLRSNDHFNIINININSDITKLVNDFSSNYQLQDILLKFYIYQFKDISFSLSINLMDEQIKMNEIKEPIDLLENLIKLFPDIFSKKLVNVENINKNLLELYRYIVLGKIEKDELSIKLFRLMELINYVFIQSIFNSLKIHTNYEYINQNIEKFFQYPLFYIITDVVFNDKDIFDKVINFKEDLVRFNINNNEIPAYMLDNRIFQGKAKHLISIIKEQGDLEKNGFTYLERIMFCNQCKTIYPSDSLKDYESPQCKKDHRKLKEKKDVFIVKEELFKALQDSGKLFEAYVYLKIREIVARMYIPCVVSHNLAISSGNIDGEIDIIIYQPFTKKLLIIDCKSTEKIESGDEEKLKKIANELKNTEQLQDVDYLLVNLSKDEKKILPISQLKQRIDSYLNKLNQLEERSNELNK